MKALNDSLALFMPPLWLGLVAATLAAAALLMAFVATLQDNARRGDDLRQGQRGGTVRQHVGTLASASPGLHPQQSGPGMSPNFPR